MLYEFIYTSQLADTAHPGCVADIVRTARNHNARHDITGILIFDGANFYQYLEGPRVAVTELVTRICADTRHVNFSVKHDGDLHIPRRFSAWSLAYALDDGGMAIENLMRTQGPETTAVLTQSMPYLDMESLTR